jgi:2-(1,2-epoxy-1,2-dihydrophenyl)acetyl-CoA isomerase
VAAGAGANFALGCDLVIAAKSASFIQAFSKIGLIPDCGGTWLLPRLVGRARAIGLAMTGDKLSAEDAERWGLIWRCVDDAELLEQAQALARRLGSVSAAAVRDTRRLIDAATANTLAQQLSAERSAQRQHVAGAFFNDACARFLARA